MEVGLHPGPRKVSGQREETSFRKLLKKTLRGLRDDVVPAGRRFSVFLPTFTHVQDTMHCKNPDLRNSRSCSTSGMN